MNPPVERSLTVAVAGSSGFLGTHLRRRLTLRGHTVVRLVRAAPDVTSETREITWSPGEVLDPHALDGIDVVVNLAGSPLIGNPHSRRWAHALMTSRVGSTTTLATAVAARAAHGLSTPALVQGNGISWYGDHDTEALTERSDSRGEALLTRVTRAWQAATEPAVAAGARVCVLRTAVVIDADSMPYRALRPLHRAGLGVRIGDGRQYFPVISLRDWVSAAVRLVEDTDASGVFNMTCPTPPTFTELGNALGEGRRTRLAVPAGLVRRVAGEMGPELVNSVRAHPAALQRLGFTFADPDVTAIVSSARRRAR
ncbi:DUF1731 domain-containing protein [Nocardioides yefusunii]|uniref:DUF1731 domain-containing protein n=1 Tax=Nocardioides yefusunii TaxID=2500546 RepID=A0ABW1QTT0_9ACTN|nr:DUF1731 domain-containing protein [Nocardioides yefusunii]